MRLSAAVVKCMQHFNAPHLCPQPCPLKCVAPAINLLGHIPHPPSKLKVLDRKHNCCIYLLLYNVEWCCYLLLLSLVCRCSWMIMCVVVTAYRYFVNAMSGHISCRVHTLVECCCCCCCYCCMSLSGWVLLLGGNVFFDRQTLRHVVV